MHPRMLHIRYNVSGRQSSLDNLVLGLLQSLILSGYQQLDPLLFDFLLLGSLLIPFIGCPDVPAVYRDDTDEGIDDHLFCEIVILLQTPFERGVRIDAGESAEKTDGNA